MKLFVFGSVLAMVLVVYYTQLGVTPLWFLIALNAILFLGITSRMISSQALTTAIPDPADRGAFMAVNSSVAQISGGIAAAFAGIIVFQSPSGHLDRYPVLGIIVAINLAITIWMMHYINQDIMERRKQEQDQAGQTKALPDRVPIISQK